MSKGRKPLPENLKKLKGTDRPCRKRDEVVVYTNIEKPIAITACRGMKSLKTQRARNIFTQKCNQLIANKILTEVDLDQLSIYADALDKLYTCVDKMSTEGMIDEAVDANGNNVRKPSPYFRIYKELVLIIGRIGSEYGFTPVSRIKLNVGEKKDDPIKLLIQELEK